MKILCIESTCDETAAAVVALAGFALVLRFTCICGWHGQAQLARGPRRLRTGKQVTDRAGTLWNFALAAAEKKDWPRAISLFEQAVDIWQETIGAPSPVRGAAGLAINTLYYMAYPSMALNVVWALIAVYAVGRLWRTRDEPAS